MDVRTAYDAFFVQTTTTTYTRDYTYVKVEVPVPNCIGVALRAQGFLDSRGSRRFHTTATTAKSTSGGGAGVNDQHGKQLLHQGRHLRCGSATKEVAVRPHQSHLCGMVGEPLLQRIRVVAHAAR